MKKILLAIAILTATLQQVQAQSVITEKDGKVGIGTTNPESNLQIGQNTKNGLIMLGGGKGYSAIGSTRSDGGLILGTNIYTRYKDSSDNFLSRVGKTSSNGFTGIKISRNGLIDFFGKKGTVSSDETANSIENIKMRINTNGYVGIGTTNPDQKLTVKGGIHCEEVLVDLQVPADYVFEKYYNGTSALKGDYKMPTLAEIETFTKKNHHLPSVPSAKTIQEEGLHLKEMTNILLQKIEELTLYTIEQEKRINALEKKLSNK